MIWRNVGLVLVPVKFGIVYDVEIKEVEPPEGLSAFAYVKHVDVYIIDINSLHKPIIIIRQTNNLT